MAIAFDVDLDSTAATASSTSISHTTSAAVAAGATINLLVGWHGAGALSSVTGGSLTWSIDKQILNGTVGIALVSAYASGGLASSTSITANLAASSTNRGISGWSFTGIASSTPVDTSASASEGTVGSWSGAAVTTTTANTVVVAALHADAFVDLTSTPGAGWTEVPATAGDFNAVGNGATFVAVYRIVSSATNWQATGTFDGGNNSDTIAHVAVAYIEGTAAAAAPAMSPTFNAIPFMGGVA